MFLSEMLPPDRVDRIVLVDKAWPRCGAESPLPHQMNWDHIYADRIELLEGDDGKATTASGGKGSGGTYFETWPVPLHTSKQDLKKRCTRKQMKRHIFDRSGGGGVIVPAAGKRRAGDEPACLILLRSVFIGDLAVATLKLQDVPAMQ